MSGEAADELSGDEVRARTGRAAPHLLARLVAVQALGLVGGILLSRTLGPAPFGALAVASAIISSLSFFGDLGLRAAMIQSFAALEEAELRAIFTVRAGLAALTGAAALLAAPAAERAVWGTDSAADLIPPLVLGLVLLEPVRSTCTALLERDLRFGRVATIEVAEVAAYYAVGLHLALTRGGAEALAGGVLARAVVGTGLGLALAAWRPRLTLHVQPARRFLRFGLSWQATQFLLFLNSLVTPVVVGRFVGDAALGFVLWAHGNAGRIMPVFEAVSRVAFPAFARLAASAEVVRRALPRTVHGGLVVACLYEALLVGTGDLLVAVLYGPSWTVGVPLLVAYAAVFPFVTVTILVDVTLLAQGRATLVRNLHALRFVAFLGAALWLTPPYGALGFVAAHVLGTAVHVAADLYVAARGGELPLGTLARVAAAPLVAGLAAVAAARGTVAAATALPPAVGLVLAATAGALAFTAVELALDRPRLFELARDLRVRGGPRG